MRMSPEALVQSIRELSREREYTYVDSRNKGRIRIVDIQGPRGPITIKRYKPSKGESVASADPETISANLILRVSNAISEGLPLNLDRVLGASYNTRSVLEALLAHTPQFYVCRPGRIQVYESSTEIHKGHKHLLWRPGLPHPAGTMQEIATDVVISELPSTSAVYEALVLPEAAGADLDLGEDVRRRHAQIQIALVMIGESLGMRTFVAKNDQAISYKGERLGERGDVVSDLSNVPLLSPFGDAVRAGSLIDCIWFRNGRFMPAVIEVEHSTGVTSGLTRMQGFLSKAPAVSSRYLIAAPDEDRERVLRECARPQFQELHAGFLPYSGVEEMYGLLQRRRLKGAVTDGFIDAFVERAA
jgi:type II restriction enzyme